MTNKTYLYFLLLSYASSQGVIAQDDSKLFQQIFGKKQKSQSLVLPLFNKKFFIGDINVKVKSDTLLSFKKSDFIKAIKTIFSKEIVNKLEAELTQNNLTNEILEKYKINLSYNQDQLKLGLSFPLEFQKLIINDAGVQVPDWAHSYLRPSTNSFILNYDLQEDIASGTSESSFFRADIEPVYQYKGFVFENEFYYETIDDDKKIRRKSSRIVKNDVKRQLSYSLGDIQYPTIGHQTSRSLLGFSISRDFSLNPYKVITPINSQEFIVEKRSLVKIYVNSRLVKVDYLDPGKHSIQDLPLNSGLNDILIETDDGTRKREFHFRRSTSSDLLAVGLSKFSVSAGVAADEDTEEKSYNSSQGATLNANYEIGLLENLTLGPYAQGDKDIQVMAFNGIYATTWGNYYFDMATSLNDETDFAYNLNYSISDFGNEGFSDYRVGAGIEWLGENFKSVDGSDTINSISYRYNLTLTKSVASGQSLSLSSFYNVSRDKSKNDPYGLNLSIDTQLNQDFSASIFLGREKQDSGNWNDSLYFFLNYNIPEKNTYMNAFYDSKNNIKRANVRYQSPKNINATNLRATVGKTSSADVYEGELEHKTAFGHLNLRHINEQNESIGHNSRTNLRLRGAFLMADNNYAFSSPVGESFALIRPNEHLKDQKLALKSYSRYEEGDNDLSDTIVIPDLTAYHFRRFQFDTRDLEPGRNLEHENFVLYPGYKTGHFLSVGKPGIVTYIGKLLHDDKAYSLKMCTLESIDGKFSVEFFTNKKGRFVIEGLKTGQYRIILKNKQTLNLEIGTDKVGIIKGQPIEIGK